MQTLNTLPSPRTAVRNRWIPIRGLSEANRPDVLAHLLALSPSDRYLRFGYAASDTQIARYVASLNFLRDDIAGVFNWKLELIAMTHVAYLAEGGTDSNLAEFGVSVAAHARGRGYGARLFDHAVLRARIRGVDTMIIHALTENTAMLRIARKAGATVEREGSDSEARLKLPPESFGTRLEALMSDQAAEFDYSVKSQAQFMQLLSSWMGADLAWPPRKLSDERESAIAE
ncbi:GNAT family N-acetyltransferase [Ideonella oryzae]|uniref:GNAT family N-acetyltransferase n=1 Tax=Ideonella oryzae TaxID=2937441 RepID=A0ABT1BL60_9BURK|nr:GNAT family N-acetyltransferase [Ideonella oryzae]MCO5976956.1 GNAT family N-acetyltransferase [Ideonella oryzae]